ncbi:hypothetical protein L6452_09950 [Arctium lappa]|uniref:Uncharacterized protein n=1 Tax=Arctium lappa TaxID=4217 RepID=A0ACB9DMQ9_ARCLA|nr:hypothetical protein L6452_09950 [Arctium lappa]
MQEGIGEAMSIQLVLLALALSEHNHSYFLERPRKYGTLDARDDAFQGDGKHIEEKKLKVDEDIEIAVSRRGSELVETMKSEQSIERKHTEEKRLSNDVEEMKSKLRELESILRQDNKLRTKRNTEPSAQIVFQLVFVLVVAIASLYLGYLLHG